MRPQDASHKLIRTLVIGAAAIAAATVLVEQDAMAQPALSVTQNSYNGSQWWGTITIKNVGTAATSSYQVEFDLPSGVHCTADSGSVPSGATLSPLSGGRTTSNHCVFTWANTTALQPGASKTFNYSADAQNFSSASNVVASVPVIAGSLKTLMHGSKCQPMGLIPTFTYSLESGVRHLEATNINFECGIDRRNPTTTGGLNELQIRFENRGDMGQGFEKTVECLAISVRPDLSIVRYVSKSVTVPPEGFATIDWGSALNGSVAYGNIGINCFLPPNIWLNNVYYSEP